MWSWYDAKYCWGHFKVTRGQPKVKMGQIPKFVQFKSKLEYVRLIWFQTKWRSFQGHQRSTKVKFQIQQKSDFFIRSNFKFHQKICGRKSAPKIWPAHMRAPHTHSPRAPRLHKSASRTRWWRARSLRRPQTWTRRGPLRSTPSPQVTEG